MNGRISNTYEVGKSSLDFLDLHIALIGSHLTLVNELRGIVARIGVVLTDCETGDREAAAANLDKARLLDVLHGRYLLPIAAIARGNAALDPAIARRFRAPKKGSNRTAYIGATHAVMTLAEEHKAVFIGDKMPEDFVAGMGRTIEEFAAAEIIVHNNHQLHVGARAELRPLARQVMALLKRFDGIFRSLFADQPREFAAWMSARNFPYPKPKLVEGGKKGQSAA